MLRHLRGRGGVLGGGGGHGFTISRDIERSSVGLGLFPTVDNKRGSVSAGQTDRQRVRRCYLGQRDLSRVVKEKTGQFLL